VCGGEPDNRHWGAARSDDHAGVAVDHRRAGELGKGPATGEDLARDGFGSRYGLAGPWTAAAGVDPEHHVGVEHRDESLEVPVAGGRQEGVDQLALPCEVGILGGRGAADAAACAAGELARGPRRRVDNRSDLVEGHGKHVVQHERFQEAVVDGGLTGRANLQLHADLWGVTPRDAAARIAELAATLGLDELLHRAVGSYSGGQRRRLEIARALVSQPRVLFLDEPTVGLDPRIRFELLDAIAELRRREDMTIVLTTHYLEEAERLCDRVAIIHAGEIVALDTPAALLAGLGGELLELRVDGDVPVALAALGAHGIAAADAYVVGQTLTVPLHESNAGEAIAALDQAGIGTSGISTRRPTLDDVYLRLTGEGLAVAA
jgi:ABC-type multidrug transport system ATPase subunit